VAIGDLTKAIAVSKHPYYVAQATTDRGEVYFKLGEYAKASDDFSTVIGLSSADAYKPGAFLNRTRSRIAEGKFAEARQDANEAIKLYSVMKARNAKKRLGEAYNLRSAINCADGKTAAARADNSKAASLGAPMAKCGLR
jgi:tetratricopeptide (TPR) repeat protein